MTSHSRAMVLTFLMTALPETLWSSGAGTSGASVLNIPVGARAIGMGEAYPALADDASSLYWNPAGIALLNQSEASFMYNQLFEDLTYIKEASLWFRRAIPAGFQ